MCFFHTKKSNAKVYNIFTQCFIFTSHVADLYLQRKLNHRRLSFLKIFLVLLHSVFFLTGNRSLICKLLPTVNIWYWVDFGYHLSLPGFNIYTLDIFQLVQLRSGVVFQCSVCGTEDNQ